MSSALVKSLIAFVTAGGVIAGTAVGVVKSRSGDINHNSIPQISVSLAQENNSNSVSISTKDFKSEDVRKNEGGNADLKTTEFQNSQKLETDSEARSDISSVDQVVNEIPKDQPEAQQEKLAYKNELVEKPLEHQVPPKGVVPEEKDNPLKESPSPTSPIEGSNIDQEQAVENGGYFNLELDLSDDAYEQDEWDIDECDMSEKDGKVILSCYSNYSSDGKKINFYINSASINAKKYDLKKLNELSWMPYGSDKSDLTLTFGTRNLVIELARGIEE